MTALTIVPHLTGVFQDVLGYSGPATLGTAECHTIKRETLVEVGGNFVDAVLGNCPTDAFEPVVVCLKRLRGAPGDSAYFAKRAGVSRQGPPP